MDEATKSVYEALNLQPRPGGIQWGEPTAEEHAPAPIEDEVGSAGGEELEQDPTQEASQEPGVEPEDEGDAVQEEPAQEPERQPLTREERARNAARRRQAQERAAVENAVRAERDATNSRVKELLERAGFRDGDRRIENLDDLDRYLERMEETRIGRDLKDGKLEMKDLQSVVDRAVAKAQTPVQEPEQEPAQSEFVTQVAEELAEIHKLDPAIQTMNDLRKLERFEEFQDAVVNHNMSFLQAYRFVHADKLAQAQAQKAAAAQAQRLRNSTSGRDHMRPVNARGSGAVPVSAEKAAAYRAVMPNMTNEEIRRAEDRARVRWGNKPSP